MVVAKIAYRGAFRVAPPRRPVAPSGNLAVRTAQAGAQGFEGREQRKIASARGDKCAQLAGARIGRRRVRAKVLMEQLEHRQLQGGHRRVIDQMGRARGRQRAREGGRGHQRARRVAAGIIGDGFDIEVHGVERQARTGRVGARFLGAREVARMQGVDADKRGTGAPGQRGDRAQVGEVADTPVAARAQRVQLDRQAPAAPAACQLRRDMASVGNHDQGAPGVKFGQAQTMIAKCKRVTQIEIQAVACPCAAVPGVHEAGIQADRLCVAAHDRTGLGCEFPGDHVHGRIGVERDFHAGRRTRGEHEHGLYRRRARLVLERAGVRAQVAVRLDAQRAHKRARRRFGEVAPLSQAVPVAAFDAGRRRQAREILIHRCGAADSPTRAATRSHPEHRRRLLPVAPPVRHRAACARRRRGRLAG